ncbi:MAG: hypothetical protein RL172_2485 [Bacteroidota bacterium]|jgi:2-polyprenyl-3-methyl-5-hydroxy-6-metoxy-1,4-benzoquinol methylase
MAIERIVPGSVEWEAYYANHIFRYQFAATVLKDAAIKNLLDAACGVGYGAHYLATHLPAVQVTAIDRSADALKKANQYFTNQHTRFLADDCHTLAAASSYGPYHAVVSFETLEHLPQPAAFLNSCFSNLHPGGQLIVSTPNKSVSSPTELNWAYHEKEYTAAELMALLLAAGFNNICLYGQQFTAKGQLKNEIRADLNRLHSNPFIRIGKWIQRLKGHPPQPVLKETLDDFELVTFNDAAACDAKGINGPFVLIAVCSK